MSHAYTLAQAVKKVRVLLCVRFSAIGFASVDDTDAIPPEPGDLCWPRGTCGTSFVEVFLSVS